jgi:hypothetical protein
MATHAKENEAPDNSEARLSSSPLPVKNTFIHYSDANKTPSRTSDWKLASPQTVPPHFAPAEGELLQGQYPWPLGGQHKAEGVGAALELLGDITIGGRLQSVSAGGGATGPAGMQGAGADRPGSSPANPAVSNVAESSAGIQQPQQSEGQSRGLAPLRLFDALNLQSTPSTSPSMASQAPQIPPPPLQVSTQQAVAALQAIGLLAGQQQPLQLPLSLTTPGGASPMGSVGMPMWPCQVGTPTAAGPCGVVQQPFGGVRAVQGCSPTAPDAQMQAVGWPSFGCGGPMGGATGGGGAVLMPFQPQLGAK